MPCIMELMIFNQQMYSKSLSSYLQDMYKARHFLLTGASETKVHAFITTKLDYCDFGLYSLPKK